ncbi:MAG: M48 family metallopeptidase [Gammaproteobacteria bacterium WSBS_2016_MAG_OTU1]
MNFFESQQQARRKTGLLVLLLLAAAAAIISLLYLAVHFALAHSEQSPIVDFPNWDLLGKVSLFVLTLIGLGSLYKIIALSGGGAAIAESMGGRLLSSPTDNSERQLLNIVSEMALASGCPTPPVYIMPDEGINAFAAGDKLGNAVIGVTHGAKNVLTRDEMQGVIAHEFSHVLNGDMKFNLRLIGIIHGVMLLSLLGSLFFRGGLYSSFGSRSRNNGAPAIMMAGVALMVVGAVGAFFGSMIRAAISRQREFLADASAVQFTRNPHGIANALQKIAAMSTHFNERPQAKQFAHMFFSNAIALGFSNMMSSHPPLDKRIKKILPNWDGNINVKLPKNVVSPDSDAAPHATAAPLAGLNATGGGGSEMLSAMHDTNRHAEGVPSNSASDSASELPDLFGAIFGDNEDAKNILPTAGATTVAGFAAAEKILTALPPIIKDALTNPYSARALIYAMLLDDKNTECRHAQCKHLESFADTGVYELTQQLAPHISALPRPLRLPLLLQTLPALRQLSMAQYELFVRNLTVLITADEKIDLFEWSLEAVLLHYLEESFGASKYKLPPAKAATEYALSLLAKAADSDNAENAFMAAATHIKSQLVYDKSPFVPQKLMLAMRRVSKNSPAAKQAFMQAAAECAAHDGIINSDEGILLRAFAAMLDCPLPPNFAADCAVHK